jgi:hypothetical protein
MGAKINYFSAVNGQLKLIPTGESLITLENDYSEMLKDGLLALNQSSFSELIDECRVIEVKINQYRAQ